MPFTPSTAAGTDYQANLRRLIISRWAVLASMLLLVAGTPSQLDIPLPQALLLSILAVSALFNGIAQWRLAQSETATAHELFSHLLVDIAALSALLFFTGGATNPLISLLLPPVAIAAMTLPGAGLIGIGLIAIAAYSGLMLSYIPLPLPDASRATHLHLIGMWLTFTVSAMLIAWFVVRATNLIRQRDAELAAAREQALRDERVIAMGTLAAGAAHELGTPLGTMALLAGELAHELAERSDLPAGTLGDINLMRQQIDQCKQIITGLSRRAAVERLEKTPSEPADTWLDSVRQHWHAGRPQAESRLHKHSPGKAPEIAADPRLEQAVLNLLNNAANACPEQVVEVDLTWRTEQLSISIRDHGPGFPAHVLDLAGKSSFPPHQRGSGIGLLLTRSAIQQLAGELTLSNPPTGGALARIDLPLPCRPPC